MLPPGIRFKSKFLILYHTSRYGWYLPFCHVGHYGIPFNFVLLKILAIPAHTSPYQPIPACTGQVFKYQQKEEYRAKSFSERLNIAIFFFFSFFFCQNCLEFGVILFCREFGPLSLHFFRIACGVISDNLCRLCFYCFSE